MQFLAQYNNEQKEVEENSQVLERHQTKETHNIPSCPYCSSTNVYGMSRVVGYFSIIDNWNRSKKAEFKRRQKGRYWFKG